jgi:hypothetical protein
MVSKDVHTSKHKGTAVLWLFDVANNRTMNILAAQDITRWTTTNILNSLAQDIANNHTTNILAPQDIPNNHNNHTADVHSTLY